MAEWVDFAEIREKVSLEDVLFRVYGFAKLKRKGHKVVGPCPVHDGDSPRAFHADLNRNIWHCFSKCQGGGNQIDFVAKREGISVREAALKLKHHLLGSTMSETPSGKKHETPKEYDGPHLPVGAVHEETTEPGEQTDPESGGQSSGADGDDAEQNSVINVRLNLKAEHPFLTKDCGLSLETIRHFGAGYCSRGIMRGTIALPVHDEAGGLVAYAGRRLKPSEVEAHGPWRYPKRFRKELVLYNLHRAARYLASDGLVLVQSPLSVLTLYEAGVPNAVACFNEELSGPQVRLLAQASTVFVLLSNEGSSVCATSVAQALRGIVPVRLSPPPDMLPGGERSLAM